MNRERAREIIQAAYDQATIGPWSDQLDKVMTKKERAEVKAFWDTLPGHTCFVDAIFCMAREGGPMYGRGAWMPKTQTDDRGLTVGYWQVRNPMNPADEDDDDARTTTMHNKAMKRKLDEGECLDVAKIGTEVKGEGKGRVFQLTRFEDGIDYCIAETEEWIWSIGRRKSDQTVFAATDARYYMCPGYECIWLR